MDPQRAARFVFQDIIHITADYSPQETIAFLDELQALLSKTQSAAVREAERCVNSDSRYSGDIPSDPSGGE